MNAGEKKRPERKERSARISENNLPKVWTASVDLIRSYLIRMRCTFRKKKRLTPFEECVRTESVALSFIITDTVHGLFSVPAPPFRLTASGGVFYCSNIVGRSSCGCLTSHDRTSNLTIHAQ